MDEFAEVQQKYGVPVQGEFVGYVEGRTEGEFLGGQKRKFEEVTTVTETTVKTGNTTLYVVGAGVAAFLIWQYAK